MQSDGNGAWAGEGCWVGGQGMSFSSSEHTEIYPAVGGSSWPVGFNTSTSYLAPNEIVASSSNHTSTLSPGYGFDSVQTTAPAQIYSATFPDEIQAPNVPSPMYLPSNVGRTCHPSRRALREGWTSEEDQLLLKRIKEGRRFAQIAHEMFTEFGISRSENCLVKRVQRIQSQYLEPLPLAMKNRMPELMEILKDEVAKLGVNGVSSHDQEVIDQVMQDLPKLLPKFVQNRVNNTRKALLNTAINRT